MRRKAGRGRYRPLIQFSKDWAVRPLNRDEMMADPPACRYHQVFFDYHFIEGPLWIILPASVVKDPQEALSR